MRLAAVVLFGLVLTVGCTQGARTGESTPVNIPGNPAGPIAPGSPAPPNPAPPDLGVPMPTQPGKITLTLASPQLSAGAPLSVTIANGLGRTIYAQDEKTDCSVLLLERWTGRAWEPVTGCLFGRTPLPVAFGNGRGRTVKIDPFSAHLNHGQPQGTPAFGRGTYRLTFSYGFSAAFGAEEPYALMSTEFAVR
ncbi:MAG TPA: hypothetical protein VGK88_09375 [bacterium]|jgi:hypothetical protein